MDQVNLLAPKLLKLRLWPDLKDPTKQWASSVVDNGYAPRFCKQTNGKADCKEMHVFLLVQENN